MPLVAPPLAAPPAKPRVTAAVASTWLRALPYGFVYQVPVDDWWRASFVLDGENGRRRYLRGRLPGTLTEAEFFARVERRPGRYYFEPVDARGRRFVDTRLAYFDVGRGAAVSQDGAPPQRG